MAISQDRRKRYDMYFSLLDRNGDGKLEKSDFEIVVDRLAELGGLAKGSPQHKGLMSAWMLTFDHLQENTAAARKGASSKEDWANTLEATAKDTAKYEKYVSPIAGGLFDLLDTNRDGSVGKDEFSVFMKAFGGSAASADEAFKLLDTDKSGSLSRDELMSIVQDFHKSDDTAARGRHLFGKVG